MNNSVYSAYSVYSVYYRKAEDLINLFNFFSYKINNKWIILIFCNCVNIVEEEKKFLKMN